MLRKKVIVLLAVAAVGVAAPTMAVARNGGGHGGAAGGGFHGAGFAGGFHGGPGPVVGGFRDGGFHDGGFHDHDFGHHRFGWNHTFYPYGYYDNYAYYDAPYGYDSSYNEDSSCSIIRRRVYTTAGWRTRPVPVC